MNIECDDKVSNYEGFFCSEEIAFYQGNKREQATILATFNRLVCTKIKPLIIDINV